MGDAVEPKDCVVCQGHGKLPMYLGGERCEHCDGTGNEPKPPCVHWPRCTCPTLAECKR